jgi:hypothetical protein
MEEWKHSQPYAVEIDTESEPGKKLYRLTNITPFDPIILAETGAIIHSIRTSFDLLACALAARNNFPDSSETSFPVVDSKAKFATRDVQRKIEQLSGVHQKVIADDLRPFRGPEGNDLLWALHQIDITRKHRRLLKTAIMPRGIGFNPGLPHGAATFVAKTWDCFYEGTVLFHTPAEFHDTEVDLGLVVLIDEAECGLRGENLISTIEKFAKIAYEALERFSRTGM